MKASVTANIFLALLVGSVSSGSVGGCASVPIFLGGRIQASARALAVQADGKLVAAGVAGIGNRLDFALARYLPDGSLDATFGVGGTVTTHFRGSAPAASSGWFAGAFARALVVQPDGKLVAAGRASLGSLLSIRSAWALARYLPDGSLDPTFGVGGTVTTDFPGSFASARALVVQPDGKLVAAGFAVIDRRDHFAVARYLSDGSLDLTFGAGGMVTTVVKFGAKGAVTPGFVNRGAFALALQPDGKLIAAGATEALNGRVIFALARFLPDGSLDRSFGTGGTVATDFGDGGVAFALALQRDGKVVAAGATGHGDFAFGKFALARYLPNGTLDRSFGVDGKVISDFGWRGVLAVGLQPDGKLVAAGAAEFGDRPAFALARYLSDGTVDAAFGVGGKVTTDFGAAKLDATRLQR